MHLNNNKMTESFTVQNVDSTLIVHVLKIYSTENTGLKVEKFVSKI